MSKCASDIQASPQVQLNDVVAALPVTIFATDSNGYITVMEGCGSTPLPPDFDRLNSRHYRQYYHDAPDMIAAFDRAMQGESFTTLIKRPGGKIIETRFYTACDELGGVRQINGLAVDVTERELNEEKLRQSQSYLQAIIDNSPLDIFIRDLAGRYLLANKYLCNKPNFRGKEVIGLTNYDLMTAEQSRWLEQEDHQVLETLQTLILEDTLVFNGQEQSYLTIKFPLLDENGQPYGVGGIVKDITDIKQMNRALHQSQAQLQAILDNSPLSIFVKDVQGVYLMVNRHFEEIMGLKRADVVGRREHDLFPTAVVDVWQQHDREVLERGEALTWDENSLQADGLHPVITTKFPLKDSSGAVYAVAGISLDITERQQAVEAMRRSEANLQAVLDNSPLPIYVKDKEGVYLLVNRRFEEIMQLVNQQIVGRSEYEFFPKEIVDAWRQHDQEVIERGEAMTWDEYSVEPDGPHTVITNKFPLKDAGGSVYAVAGISLDITERRRAEQALAEELLKNSKLESLGVLAGGIAHDFNNILTAIIGNVTLARLFAAEGPPKESELNSTLQEVEKAALRARDLTLQLLTFARGGAPVKKTALLPALIRESAEFALRGSNVHSEMALSDELWPVEIDGGQISQVIHNLVINSMQAMPEGGIIHLEATNLMLAAGESLPLPPGPYIKLYMYDHGMGIPAEDLSRIFDPYFTTKQHGSGLGLASCFSIIKHHAGHITVESEVGRGTRFSLYLPASPNAAAEPRAAAAEVAAIKPGLGRILVMDDEASIRTMMTKVLLRIGYSVEVACDGQEAILLYRQALRAGQPFTAVIMDLTVPGRMGGKELLERLLKVDPQVRAIVSSGYSHDPVMSNYAEYGFKGIVSKPYQLDELTATLSRVTGAAV